MAKTDDDDSYRTISTVSTSTTTICDRSTTITTTTDWRSIYLSSFIAFAGAVQFSIYFSSLWPYLLLMDRDADERFFGYIIAIYSFGQCISSPLFGYMSNRMRQAKVPLLIGLVFMFLGNIVYISIELLTYNRRYVMLAGRFITGFGSGNVAVIRAYASTASRHEDRSRAIAFCTGGIALGLTCGPAFQVLFTPIGEDGITIGGIVHISMYTAPSYCASLMNLVAAVCMMCMFKESYAGLIDKSKLETRYSALPKYDRIAIGVCLLCRFTQMFISTNLETIGSPFSMLMFNLSKSQAVLYNSLAQGALGAMSFSIYLIYILGNLGTKINYRLCCFASLILLIVFHLVTFSWPFLPGSIQVYDQNNNTNVTIQDESNIGCDLSKYPWCLQLKPVNMWIYYISYALMIGIAFPTINVTMNTLYSQILGARRQGTMQGVLQLSGSAARMTGPLLISLLFASFGPRIAWLIELSLIAVTSALWLIFYTRLIPLRGLHQLASGHIYRNKFGFIYRL